MTQEFVTLPREVVDQAIAAMQRAGEQRGSTASEVVAMEAMRAALEQSTDNHDWYQLGFREGVVKGREELSAEYPLPADLYDSKDWRCGTYAERVEWLHTMYEDAKEQIAALEQPQNHVPDVGNMVQAGWMPVPVEPTEAMLDAGCEAVDGPDWTGPNSVYRAMLDAAPQPPTVKESLTVEQPQADQPAMTPIAQRKLEDLMASGYTISGYSVYHERKHQHGFVTGAGLVGWWKPDGVEYPQPQVDPEPVTLLRFNTWSSNEGDSWYDCPTDAQIIEDVFGGETPMVGAEYEVSAGWRCVTATYRITWVSENGDCEAECISHPQENASSASTPRQPQGEQEPVAVIGDVWTLNFVGGDPIATIVKKHGLKIGDKLYTHPQNLNCKSTQARLATLWGYVKEQPKREPLTHYEIHELFRRSWDDCQDGDEIKAFARAIEAAHNIK